MYFLNSNVKNILIIYDIRNDKRRRKLVKILESYGIRVQYSAFEFQLSNTIYQKMFLKIKKVIYMEDSVKIYIFNANTQTISLGCESDLTKFDDFTAL